MSFRPIQLVVPLAAALLLSGCGGSSQESESTDPTVFQTMSTQQLAALHARTVSLMSSATGVHVTGTWRVEGGSVATFDVALDNAGDAQGDVHTKDASGKDVDLTILRTGDKYWVQLTADLLVDLADGKWQNMDPAAVERNLNKWTPLDVTAPGFKYVETLYDMKSFTARPQPDENLTEQAEGDSAVGGHVQVYMLIGDQGHHYEISATGDPYPVVVKVTYTDNTQDSTQYSDWNAVPPITAPAADQLVDLSTS